MGEFLNRESLFIKSQKREESPKVLLDFPGTSKRWGAVVPFIQVILIPLIFSGLSTYFHSKTLLYNCVAIPLIFSGLSTLVSRNIAKRALLLVAIPLIFSGLSTLSVSRRLYIKSKRSQSRSFFRAFQPKTSGKP